MPFCRLRANIFNHVVLFFFVLRHFYKLHEFPACEHVLICMLVAKWVERVKFRKTSSFLYFSAIIACPLYMHMLIKHMQANKLQHICTYVIAQCSNRKETLKMVVKANSLNLHYEFRLTFYLMQLLIVLDNLKFATINSVCMQN